MYVGGRGVLSRLLASTTHRQLHTPFPNNQMKVGEIGRWGLGGRGLELGLTISIFLLRRNTAYSYRYLSTPFANNGNLFHQPTQPNRSNEENKVNQEWPFGSRKLEGRGKEGRTT